jgi:hypothetical protein
MREYRLQIKWDYRKYQVTVWYHYQSYHITVLYISGPTLGATYNRFLLRLLLLVALLMIVLYIVDFTSPRFCAVIIIDYFYATLLGTSRVEIPFRAYRPNSNKTQYNSMLKYVFVYTTLIILISQYFTNYSPNTALSPRAKQPTVNSF